jgi:hypothetical protein
MPSKFAKKARRLNRQVKKSKSYCQKAIKIVKEMIRDVNDRQHPDTDKQS